MKSFLSSKAIEEGQRTKGCEGFGEFFWHRNRRLTLFHLDSEKPKKVSEKSEASASYSSAPNFVTENKAAGKQARHTKKTMFGLHLDFHFS